ncbi:hypothetical protein AZH53_04105 [Methanomicrobiaceae archaeon CYW5]|uniref:PAS domain S-box protein n=1 Tax=Methanovulcanius yangii TaxID=1789227 RepID=UPI0029CAABA9|nr:PAS domain S-box protein [Methanovulcanius yangii]MBT8507602.1 hypothetical protein [Methanovulcanius yangii]
MKENHAGLTRILDLLKENPRGMSVTQISDTVGMNRITVGHYLEILRTSGEVDMETFGQSKVYFLSHRVPISALMNHSSDYVLVLDNSLKIVYVNRNVIALLHRKKEDILNKNIRDILHRLDTGADLRQIIDQALGGEEVVEEIRIVKDSEEYFFRMKVVPTVFQDGSPGITIILEDTTEYHKSLQALQESEEKFRDLLEKINELMVRVEEISELNDQIRNPLQVIVGISDLEDVGVLEQIQEQAHEIDRIIRQINIGNKEAENIRTFIYDYAERTGKPSGIVGMQGKKRTHGEKAIE